MAVPIVTAIFCIFFLFSNKRRISPLFIPSANPLRTCWSTSRNSIKKSLENQGFRVEMIHISRSSFPNLKAPLCNTGRTLLLPFILIRLFYKKHICYSRPLNVPKSSFESETAGASPLQQSFHLCDGFLLRQFQI